jgi:hypothetical protein
MTKGFIYNEIAKRFLDEFLFTYEIIYESIDLIEKGKVKKIGDKKEKFISLELDEYDRFMKIINDIGS